MAGVLVVGAATYPGMWFPASSQGRWFFTFPVLGSPDLAHWKASSAYYGALVVLGVAWVWLLRAVRADHRFPTWIVLAVFALWSVPFTVGPPVSSDDAVVYAGVGRLVERGFDPYEVGVGALDPEPVAAAASSFWRESPAPYGPLYLRVAWTVTVLTGDSFRAAVVLLRLFGLACLALLALPLSALARRAGNPPAFALAAVLCSPLVVVQLVGAAHNETLMILLLTGGVTLGLAGLAGAERGPRPALVAAGAGLCGAAAAVKLPGLLGAVFLGWLWAGSEAPVRRRLMGAAAAGGLASAVVVVISLVTGLGLGWVGALDAPQKAYTIVAPFTAFGIVLEEVLDIVGWSSDWVLPALRTTGALAGIAGIGLFLWRADRLGGPLALGMALFCLAWTTPAVWPWYLVWGLAFVGTVTMPVGLQVAVIASNLVVTPLGPGTLDVNGHPSASAVFVTLLVLGSAVLVYLRATRRSADTSAGLDVADA